LAQLAADVWLVTSQQTTVIYTAQVTHSHVTQSITGNSLTGNSLTGKLSLSQHAEPSKANVTKIKENLQKYLQLHLKHSQL